MKINFNTTKGQNENTLKALLVATAFSFSVANAGDLSITGSAKASYSITSSDNVAAIEQDKGLV